MATLLQLVNQAQREMGLSVTTAVATSTVADVVQQLGLLNAVGYELTQEKDWQRITKEYRFPLVYYAYTGDTLTGSVNISNMSSTTGLTATPTYFSITGTGLPQDVYLASVSGTTAIMTLPATASGTTTTFTFSQTLYAMPSDYDRLVDKTDWDKSKHWENLGPETGQQWQWLKSGFISTGPRIRFRQLGGFFQVWPPSGISDYMGYEYVSNQWVLASTDVVTPSKTAFTVDTDTCIFPDRLMVLGLKHKYFQVKGFGDIYRDEYMDQLSRAKAFEAGSPTLSMMPRRSEYLITNANIPDSGYGS